MTISSTTRVAGPFTGNGATSNFPFAFKVFAAADLYVATLDLATGAIATLSLTSDYTVALNADQDTSPGGSVTLVATGQAGATLAAGYTLTITTGMPALQNLDLTNGGAFYPDTINNALDTLVILLQQVLAQLGRALQAPVVDGSPGVVLPVASERAGKVLMFDSTGNIAPVQIAPGTTLLAGEQATGNVDGANKNFNFAALSSATPAPLVYLGGVYQTPGVDYTSPVTSNGDGTWKIAFTNAPTQGPVTVVLFG